MNVIKETPDGRFGELARFQGIESPHPAVALWLKVPVLAAAKIVCKRKVTYADDDQDAYAVAIAADGVWTVSLNTTAGALQCSSDAEHKVSADPTRTWKLSFGVSASALTLYLDGIQAGTVPIATGVKLNYEGHGNLYVLSSEHFIDLVASSNEPAKWHKSVEP